MKLINYNTTLCNSRGFKSLHCQQQNDRELQKKRNISVTRQLHDKGVRRLITALCLREFSDLRRVCGKRSKWTFLAATGCCLTVAEAKIVFPCVNQIKGGAA